MTDGGRPPRVELGQQHIREALEETSRLLLCLDFDGTLAPITSDPDDAAATQPNREVLESLAERDDIVVAIVSGRALDDVRSRVDVDSVHFSGNHGLELVVDGDRSTHPDAERCLPTLTRVRDELEPRLAPLDGCWVEDKRLTLTVHTRLATPEDTALARARTNMVVGALGGNAVRIEEGKRVLELLPDVPTGKGRAVRRVRERVGEDALPVYVGDDTADEDAFRELADDGIGIHVGEGIETAADYRVEDPTAVAPMLRWLARERRRC